MGEVGEKKQKPFCQIGMKYSRAMRIGWIFGLLAGLLLVGCGPPEEAYRKKFWFPRVTILVKGANLEDVQVIDWKESDNGNHKFDRFYSDEDLYVTADKYAGSEPGELEFSGESASILGDDVVYVIQLIYKGDTREFRVQGTLAKEGEPPEERYEVDFSDK